MKIVPFKPRNPVDEAAGKMAQARALLAEVAATGSARDRREALKMTKAATRPIGGYMRLWDAREREIEEDLEADAQVHRDAGKAVPISIELTLGVLRAARNSLTTKSQRMGKSQAAVARERGITPAQASHAFAALARAGAVLNRKPDGRSVSWEIDARYCSRLDDPTLEAAIKAQDAWRDEDARDTRKQAALDKIGHKVLPWPDSREGRIDDERQPTLID